MSGILILGFVSATLCLNNYAETKVKYFNVMDYGAYADGTTDDSNVYISFSFFFFFLLSFLFHS